MRKACAECGEEFEAKRKAATYCSGRCTKRAQRRPQPDSPPPTPLRPTGESAPSPTGGVESATRAELERAGRDESAAGQSALALACRIDASSGETGSGVAALVREHRAVLAEALKDAETATDPIDELRTRRERKLASG